MPAVIPDSFLKAMPAEERKKLGRAGLTREEAERVYLAGQERTLKGLAVNECLRRGAWIFEQSMRKRTGGKKGTPDIIGCHRGYFFAIELKATGQTMSPEQVYEAGKIKKAGGLFTVAFCLRDVQAILNAIDLL